MRERKVELKKAVNLLNGMPCPEDCPIQTGKLQSYMQIKDGVENYKLACIDCGMHVDLDSVKVVYKAPPTQKQIKGGTCA